MNSEERVLNALQRKEVDRIPTFEWSIDKKVIEKISPGSTIDEFLYKMDIDACIVELDYKKEEIEPGIFRDEWGNKIEYSEEFHSLSIEGCIKTNKDFDKYSPPDPLAPHRFEPFEKARMYHDNKKAIIIRLNDVFSIPRNLLGYENLFLNIASNPALIRDLVELSVEYNLILAKEAVKRGAKIIFTGDDYAYRKGLLISPKTFNDIFYPGFQKVIKGFKELGLLVIKHTDGDIWEIIDQLIDAGIDCLDPIEPTSNMSIAKVKEKYGDRISIKGNVDCSEILTFGTAEEVIEETKRCISEGTPGYGFILSSSNTIHSGVKPENYIAMLDTLSEFGKYPIYAKSLI